MGTSRTHVMLRAGCKVGRSCRLQPLRLFSATSEEMFQKKVWAVVGSHGRNPIAAQLVERLEYLGKIVHRVNPHPHADGLGALKRLSPLPEVVDLVVSPKLGQGVVDEMGEVGIRHLFVQ